MAENPDRNEEQQAATPEELDRASTPDDRPTNTRPADRAGAANGAGAGAAAETSSRAPDAAETPSETAASADVGVSADEVEAAMQEMLEASEKPPTGDATDEATGVEGIAVSEDEVEAAMQEVLTTAGQSAADNEFAEAADGDGGAVFTDTVGAGARTAPDVSAHEPAPLPPHVTPFQAPNFCVDGSTGDTSAIDLLDDVELDVKIELGRTEMYIEDVLGLGPGSVVELDKAAGDAVDIFVNDRLVARGEVLVLNDNFCVRINDILSPIPELEREE